MRMIFHIGWPKTGTTAFQSWLAGHEPLLEERGILYPKTGRDSVGAHNCLVFPIIRDPHFPPVTTTEKIWGELAREIGEKASKKDYGTLILSSEIFTLVKDFGPLFEFLRPFRGPASLLAVVRRQTEMLPSIHAQHVCDPHLHTTETLMETFESNKRRFLYHEILNRLERSGLWDRVQVFDYGTDVLSKLIGWIGLDFLPDRPAWLNASPPPELIETIRRANAYEMPLKDRKQLNEGMFRSALKRPPRSPLLNEQEVRTVEKYYEASNADLLKDYGVDLLSDRLPARQAGAATGAP